MYEPFVAAILLTNPTVRLGEAPTLSKENNMNEKKLRKFKLIDREGFINASSGNRALLLSEYCTNDTIEGYLSTAGNLLVGRSMAIINSEFQYFEEIKEDNNMKPRVPVTKQVRKPVTGRVTAPHKAPFTPPFTTTEQTTKPTTVPDVLPRGGHLGSTRYNGPACTLMKAPTKPATKPAYVNVGTSGHVDQGKTPVKPTMTAGTRKSLEELLERAQTYQAELAVPAISPCGKLDLSLEHAHILLAALNNNRQTIEHFQNALKEG